MPYAAGKLCAICTEPLNNKNRTKEHIIPNSIGGRRKTTEFICNTCNNKLGHTWDAELARQLNWCSLMVDVFRESGKAPRQLIQTVDGSRYWLEADGSMVPEKPIYAEESEGRKTTISISARDMREAHRMLKDVKRHHPEFDVEKACQNLEAKTFYLDSPIHLSMKIGGPESGRSIVKTACAHASYCSIPHHDCEQALAYLRNQDCPPSYGFSYLSDCIKNRPKNTIFHCVSVFGDPKCGKLISYVEYFGLFRFLISLNESYTGRLIQNTYAINPTTGETLSIDIDWSACTRDLGTILEGGGYSEMGYKAAADYAMPIILKRNDDMAIGKASAEAFSKTISAMGLREGDVIPLEKNREFANLMVDNLSPFIHHLITRHRH